LWWPICSLSGASGSPYHEYNRPADRTIQGAEAKGLPLNEFTEAYIKEFLKDIDALRIKRAAYYPKASEHVEDMIELGRNLLKKGFAYEKMHSLYFDISRFKNYGRLSRVDLKKIKLGKTVDLDEYEKDNPQDFTCQTLQSGRVEERHLFCDRMGKCSAG
jgi:cysteinyl-tRNA synthetase